MVRLFDNQTKLIDSARLMRVTGRVADVTGLTVVSVGLPAPVGSLCRIDRAVGEPISAQVVGLQGRETILMALQEPLGVAVDDKIITLPNRQYVKVGRQMLGCVVDGLGRRVGGKAGFAVEAHYPVYQDAPPALSRSSLEEPLATGICAIDAMHTVAGGQRLGIFAGTGVGKSVLLGMISRFTAAEVSVIALIGERGREVGDFIRKELGDEGMKRTVMVISTSDESPVLRVRAGFVATAIAEFFRDQGNEVLLLMDSTTRIAMAQRQIGLAAGEPPTTKGYPPSVFSLLPRLLERSGKTSLGSITGLYTVLVEGDDINEPISDAIRGILDGHIWLSRDLANRGHYPAISVLESISRVMPDVVAKEHFHAAATVRKVLAVWQDIEDLVNVGAYAEGANVEFDVAVKMKPAIDQFLVQGMHERAGLAGTCEGLIELAKQIDNVRDRFSQRGNSTRAAQQAS